VTRCNVEARRLADFIAWKTTFTAWKSKDEVKTSSTAATRRAVT
jgi:hypothetical protein